MAFPNISDILATTIESRTRQIADNVTKNNAILMKLSMKGKIKPFSGGHKILQELSFAENSNAGWYSGYDILPVGVSDDGRRGGYSQSEVCLRTGLVPLQSG